MGVRKEGLGGAGGTDLHRATLYATIAQNIDADPSTATISTASTVFTQTVETPIVAFDSVSVDVGGMADLVNDRIIIQQDGEYDLGSKVTINDGTATTVFYTQIIKNGTEVISVNSTRTPGNTNIPRFIHDAVEDVPLSAGDYIEIRSKRWGNSSTRPTVVNLPDMVRLSVSQKATTAVVMPDALDVGDSKVLLGVATISNAQTLSISENWGDLEGLGYETVVFSWRADAQAGYLSGNARGELSVPTKSWPANANAFLKHDSGVATPSEFALKDMLAGGNTLTLDENNNTLDNVTIEVFGVKSQKQVINTTFLNPDFHIAGDNVPDQEYYFGKSGMWHNNSGGVLQVPSTPNVTTLTAAGFTRVLGSV